MGSSYSPKTFQPTHTPTNLELCGDAEDMINASYTEEQAEGLVVLRSQQRL